MAKKKKKKVSRKRRERVAHPESGCRTFEEWKYEVDRQFRLRTYCSWHDLCGDEEPLKTAFDRGHRPQEFVVWWIKKYRLTDHSASSGFYL